MKLDDYMDIIAGTRLFEGMAAEEARTLLTCLDARPVSKSAGQYFILQGDEVGTVSILVEGRATGESVAADGKAATVHEFFAGDMFGDVLSGSTIQSIVGVRADTGCVAVQFAFDNMIVACRGNETQQARLLRNLINVISDKYFAQNERLSVLLCTSLRQKISLYLTQQSKREGSAAFELRHNREDMAKYIGCERSALSRELSRMKAAGLIEYRRNAFKILDFERIERLDK